MSNPDILPTYADVSTASYRLRSAIPRTACDMAHAELCEVAGMELYLKKDFLLPTGSFKERGARNTLTLLTPDQKKGGVVAASAGNHALALAYHGRALSIQVTVFMPLTAPIMKIHRCRYFGANVIQHGIDLQEAKDEAMKYGEENDMIYVNGYDHPNIISGQGTMGVEIMEQVPDIDAVIIPVGGGGLIAGMSLAIKALNPNVEIIGVESERCPSFQNALKEGKPVFTVAEATLADGLAVPIVGGNSFEIAKNLVDRHIIVKEKDIAVAILRLVELEKAVVEGGGACALAACIGGYLPDLKGKKVAIPLCGGNIDSSVLGRCIMRGMAADSRLIQFVVLISDKPGGIARLTKLLADISISIKDVTHQRAYMNTDVFSVRVSILAETRDKQHKEKMMALLDKEGYQYFEDSKSHL